MSTDGIDALLRKREELMAQIQGLQSAVFHIDQALALIGYGKGAKARRFANGELMALVCEAERAGHQTATRIAQYIMAAKGMDASDKALSRRMVFAVKDCRKRMAARGT